MAEDYSSVTPYHFALNNPVSMNDPSGLMSVEAVDALLSWMGENGIDRIDNISNLEIRHFAHSNEISFTINNGSSSAVVAVTGSTAPISWGQPSSSGFGLSGGTSGGSSSHAGANLSLEEKYPNIEEIRELIAKTAEKYAPQMLPNVLFHDHIFQPYPYKTPDLAEYLDTRWAFNVERKIDGVRLFKEGSNKCNLFVYEVLLEAGVKMPLTSGNTGRQWLIGGSGPISAGDWGDKNKVIEGWKIVDKPQRGDVAAYKDGNYDDATGHVGIYIGNGQGVWASSTHIRKASVDNKTWKTEREIIYRRLVGKPARPTHLLYNQKFLISRLLITLIWSGIGGR